MKTGLRNRLIGKKSLGYLDSLRSLLACSLTVLLSAINSGSSLTTSLANIPSLAAKTRFAGPLTVISLFLEDPQDAVPYGMHSAVVCRVHAVKHTPVYLLRGAML